MLTRIAGRSEGGGLSESSSAFLVALVRERGLHAMALIVAEVEQTQQWPAAAEARRPPRVCQDARCALLQGFVCWVQQATVARVEACDRRAHRDEEGRCQGQDWGHSCEGQESRWRSRLRVTRPA